MHTFSEFVCKWVGAVHDCYFLQSRSSSGELCPFDARTDLKVVIDSDVEEEMVDKDRIIACPQPEDFFENFVRMYGSIDDEYGSGDES